MGRKKEAPPVFLKRADAPPLQGIDLDKIVPKREARRFTSREFIFSDALTQKSELEEELEELETYKEQNKGQRALQTLVTTGGGLGLVYLSVKGLTNVERWIKQQELRDIEEEIELTGNYISVDASDVDSAIDPTTGKNMTISRGKPSSMAAVGEAAPAKAPWLLRVLGLGETVSADDDAFWESAVASSKGPGKSKKPKGDADSPEGSGPDGSTDGDGGDDDDDDDDDDSSGIDALDDLLG